MTDGMHCPIGLPDSYDPWEPYVRVLWEDWKREDGAWMQTGERINGFCQCPKCGLWWPNIEEPDMWTENDDGWMQATGWWGGCVCSDCDLLMIEQPDGTPECYDLGRT